jgi:hypothetical protein
MQQLQQQPAGRKPRKRRKKMSSPRFVTDTLASSCQCLCSLCTTDLLCCCLQLFSGAATTTSRPVAARPTPFQPTAPAPPRPYQQPRQQYQQPYQQQYQQQPQRPQPPPSASTVQFNAPGGAMQPLTQYTAILSAPTHADTGDACCSHRPNDHQQLPGSASAHRLWPGSGVCSCHCEGRGWRGGGGQGTWPCVLCRMSIVAAGSAA